MMISAPAWTKASTISFRLINHQMCFQRQTGPAPHRSYDRKSQTDVGHELTIHDIDVESVCSCLLRDLTSSPSFKKSAERIDGAILIMILSPCFFRPLATRSGNAVQPLSSPSRASKRAANGGLHLPNLPPLSAIPPQEFSRLLRTPGSRCIVRKRLGLGELQTS